jgi:AcrR family transcriptional regulator
MPSTRGQETRERILDVALELFTSQGYDKTSLRDIAVRLGITKAALYYYFERKDDILLELHLRLHAVGTQVADELEAVQDGPARVEAWPRALRRVVDYMAANPELVSLHRRNPSAMEALHRSERNRLENDEFDARLIQMLRSPLIPLRQRVRMACAMGAIAEAMVELAGAFTDAPPEQVAALVSEAISDLIAPGDRS